MSKNLKNSKGIKLNKNGELDLPEELQSEIDEVAGGINPEELENEDALDINGYCPNYGCGRE